VAVNFTAQSDEALRQAHLFARARGAPLIACHVAPWVSWGFLPFPPVGDRGSVEARLADLVRDLVREETGRSPEEFEANVEVGKPAAEIVRRAEESRARAVVVGSHGHSRLAEIFLGEVAEDVVRHAHCSVLVARAHAATRRIVAGTDLSERAGAAIEAAVEQARLVAARVIVVYSLGRRAEMERWMIAHWGLHPVEKERVEVERVEVRRRLASQLAGYRVDGDVQVVDGDPAASIVHAASELDADLVVVGATGATALRRALLGSVTEKVVRAAPCSVLVVRGHRLT
jgi:nucleotide-binding universal stress UspA family protein